MNIDNNKLTEFINYCKFLNGDEKGEAQVFCDRLFQVFGYPGYKEAGAVLEQRIKFKGSRVKFADLVWKDRVIIEMKSKGVKLESFRNQVFDYWWKLRPNQPQYAVLCNFDELCIYNFSKQDEPLDKFKIIDLDKKYPALNFLFKDKKEPIFRYNNEKITRVAAASIAKIYTELIKKGEKQKHAERFILQCIFSMFAQHLGLLPEGFFSLIIKDSIKLKNHYKLIGGLFKQMDTPVMASDGIYKNVRYFNGGLFNKLYPIKLSTEDMKLLYDASVKDWSKVSPVIFGTIFQQSMNKKERHAYGAHFTSEEDINKIVKPTIIDPWIKKINRAKKLKELKKLREDILKFKVLDPACGSGNFLYVAFRQLARLEMDILNKAYKTFSLRNTRGLGTFSLISPKQFYGIDNNNFAVELTKVTLILAKELSLRETQNNLNSPIISFDFNEEALPLENLDNNIICDDALFCKWPSVDVIIGNPPFQSKNKMNEEFGMEYINKLHNKYKNIPGRADYCVYWFNKAHNEIKEGSFVGLVGTNTIRQNYSRIGGLDYIINNGGTIINAVSSQVWSGDAVVFVSIVCWKKGTYNEKKELYVQNKYGGTEKFKLENINSSLSLHEDVTKANILKSNRHPKKVFQGQTHGNRGFLVSKQEAQVILAENDNYKEVLKPYLTGKEFLNSKYTYIKRYIIDFTSKDINEAAHYTKLFEIVKLKVLPDREMKAYNQKIRNNRILSKNPHDGVNKHHINFYKNWWQLSYGREDMLKEINKLSRYVVISRVAKRPIFDFVSSKINPNDALMVFAFEDDYSFGILQSRGHIDWYHEKCSTLKGDPRYTTNSIWDTFPWPQDVSNKEVEEIAKLSRELRCVRKKIMLKNNYSLRDIYKILELPGKNILKDIHKELDNKVIEAYNFSKRSSLLHQILELNQELYKKEEDGNFVEKPGIPHDYGDYYNLISTDCINDLCD